MSSEEDSRVVPLRRKARCHVCGRPADDRHRPFCSRHCADVDLARWFGGSYRVATEESPADATSRGGEEG